MKWFPHSSIRFSGPIRISLLVRGKDAIRLVSLSASWSPTFSRCITPAIPCQSISPLRKSYLSPPQMEVASSPDLLFLVVVGFLGVMNHPYRFCATERTSSSYSLLFVDTTKTFPTTVGPFPVSNTRRSSSHPGVYHLAILCRYGSPFPFSSVEMRAPFEKDRLCSSTVSF